MGWRVKRRKGKSILPSIETISGNTKEIGLNGFRGEWSTIAYVYVNDKQ